MLVQLRNNYNDRVAGILIKQQKLVKPQYPCHQQNQENWK